MASKLVPVGVREFREGLAEYLDSPSPLAITRHGQTIGYYLPVRVERNEEKRRRFMEAAERLDKLLAEHDISEDEVVREFKARRRRTQAAGC